MGQYNPHAPYILGQEWVPIRHAPYVPDGVIERGYTFMIDATTIPVSGAFYVNKIPDNRLANACDFIAVYPSGREMLSGPVKKINIPASAITVNNPGSIDVTAGVNALLNPEDTEFIIFTADTGISSQLRVSFDTNTYAAILLGKRILDVRIRYALSSFNLGNADSFSFAIKDTVNSTITFPQATEMTSIDNISKVSTLSISEMNPFWDTTAIARGQRTILPWRFQELNRFRSGASPPLVVSLQNNATGFDVFLGFMDLEVIYCEETRVLYGGFKTYDTTIANSPVLPIEFYNAGAIATRLYNPETFTQGNTLSAGEYVVTIYHRDMSSRSIYQGAPQIHANREYYQLPRQRVRWIQQTLVEDEQFTIAQPDPVLTQITLHTATQIVTGVHPYGTSFGAPIYGARIATQSIEDDPAAGAYTQVRYYARRYGNTTIPLTLTRNGGMVLPGTAGSFASTPDVAALDVLGDIDLRIDLSMVDWTDANVPVLMSKWGAVGQLSWQFYIDSAGTLNANVSSDGTLVGLSSFAATVPISPRDGQRLALRFTLDVDNGAGGKTATFYTAPTIDGPWTQVGATVTQAGTTSIFNSTSPVRVGTQQETINNVTGIVYAAAVLNGIADTEVANPNFAIQPSGTTSFTDAAGRVWTLNGAATLVGSEQVSISVASFDALEEIVDGWREVNLTFSTPVAIAPSAGTSDWRWSASSELTGNQWQVMVASGPSGAWGPNANAAATGPATYWAPLGSTDALIWQSPGVSGVANDTTSDAVLIFSQDPPTVTGFAVTTLSQAVSGIGTACLPSACVPTGVRYNRLTWSTLPYTTALSLPGIPGSYASTPDNAALDIVGDIDLRTDLTLSDWSPGVFETVVSKWNQEGTNQRSYALQVTDTGGLQFVWSSDGINALAASSTTTVPVVNGGRLAIRATLDVDNGAAGRTITFYTASTIDGTWVQLGAPVVQGGVTSIFAGTAALEIGTHSNGTLTPTQGIIHAVEVRNGIAGSAVANPDFRLQAAGTTTFTDAAGRVWTLHGEAEIIATPVNTSVTALEIQRSDALTDWQTVMLSTDPLVTAFSDFEARVGVLSLYRIRTLNVLDFAGPWVTGSGTIPAPGVTLNAPGAGNSVLIFTSNASVAASLAYVMQWESRPAELFSFPEADTVSLQRLFGRDFFMAVRPLERGGERFKRTILVNNAAIALPSLANFRQLRDLVWADLDYVCVRDELGNRWFATVIVPDGVVQGDRTIYLAEIEVIQTTDTASPFDPA